jgi:hypothetical protein
VNRDELERAIKAACANIEEGQVIVFGSQSILGTYDETELPEYATLSREVDVFPRSGIEDPQSPEVVEKIYTINARLGEGSPFHEHHGIYVEGIHKDVVVLPKHWEYRLVAVTVDDGSVYGRTGYCLDPVDLCASKAVAGREKDHVFVAKLVENGIVAPREILDRIDSGIEWPDTYIHNRELTVERARNWLAHLEFGPVGTPAGPDLDPTRPAPERSSAQGEGTPTPDQGHPWSLRQMLKGQSGRTSDTGRGPTPDASPARDRGTDLGG